MFVQHFTMTTKRVPDPMRPGRTAPVGVLVPSGNTSISHGGKSFAPDDSGWVEVPHEVGVHLCSFRHNGSGFYTPAEVDEQVRLGFVDGPVGAPRPGRPRKNP
jgi:hypothetical protein